MKDNEYVVNLYRKIPVIGQFRRLNSQNYLLQNSFSGRDHGTNNFRYEQRLFNMNESSVSLSKDPIFTEIVTTTNFICKDNVFIVSKDRNIIFHTEVVYYPSCCGLDIMHNLMINDVYKKYFPYLFLMCGIAAPYVQYISNSSFITNLLSNLGFETKYTFFNPNSGNDLTVLQLELIYLFNQIFKK